jgi:hypothetical protein
MKVNGKSHSDPNSWIMEFDIDDIFFIKWAIGHKVCDMEFDHSLLPLKGVDKAQLKTGLELEGRFKIAFEELAKKVMYDGQ